MLGELEAKLGVIPSQEADVGCQDRSCDGCLPWQPCTITGASP